MAVRFKFRSSATFDSINIGNQAFISIRDLKSEIVKKKNLNLCQDFDLVFSDFTSGQEYKDENVRIPSGSSVIIKRVPAASTSPLFRAGDFSAGSIGGREANHVNTGDTPAMNDGAGVFDDFGVDLCPLPDAKAHDVGKLHSNNKENKNGLINPRYSDELLVRCPKLDAIQPSQSTPRDSSANEVSTLVMQSKPKIEEQMPLQRTFPVNHPDTEKLEMPSELKCTLCRNFFKEAVMIPCCQHSFCEKCIRRALDENTKCPMCSSTKCKAEDLLPNVSLRQAIERFLESQLLINGSENDLHRYAPDGESGIQVKELSCTASVTQRDFFNCSATGKRSIPIMQNKLHGSSHLADMQCKPGTVEDSTGFQGENDPQNMVRTDEEDSCTKKEDRFHVINGGEEASYTTPCKARRGQRTCYMCGSPDHLIRDCPVATSSHTNQWGGDAFCAAAVPGCAPQYWPGSPPNVRPFANMYGGPGMLYNAAMPPMAPFVYPSYAPSMYGVYPGPSGRMKLGVGDMAPPMGNNGQQPNHVELLQARQKQQRNYNGDLERERICTQYDNMERVANQSDDSRARRSEGKHRSCNHSDDDTYSYGERQGKISRQEGGRDHRIHTRDDRHEKHHRSSRTNDEERVRYAGDSKRESVKWRRTEHDQRKYDRELRSHSRSSREHSYSSDGAGQRRQESPHRSRHPKRTSSSNDKEFDHDKEKMTKYRDDYGEYYHGHKRKRYH